ncbi:MAG: stalk domain-containing protein [Clostridiales bacterium]|jgi:hypothetical protein|nr:stalk domain-containing protein [Clostridiales bacterium]MDR2711987.1 hypothetical protein [Clostridiales bacterium]
MKKIKMGLLATLLILLFIFVSANLSWAAGPYIVYYNGKEIKFDVAPYEINGRLMVPVRTISETIGATVLWSEATETVTVLKPAENGTEDWLELKPGSLNAKYNNIIIPMDTAPQSRGGRTFLPLRFICEWLGLGVNWVEDIITIYTKNAPANPDTGKYDNYLAKYEPARGCYLGAYVYQDELIKGDMATFNELTGKKHASFFRYFGYKQGSFTDLRNWLKKVKNVDAAPHLAVEPNRGLDEVLDDEYLHELATILAEVEGPVFLRWASEMNGDWSAYSGDPQKYIQKWRLVHDVMEKIAPDVIMVWTVFTFPQRNILSYYPGDKYVDWVGVNIYNVIYHNDNINDVASHEDPLQLLDYVYNTFSPRKPIQISEYGVTHYTVTDKNYYIDFAVQKLTRMYDGIKNRYPRVKSIFYFDVNNLVNAPEGRQINNYAVTDEPVILDTYKRLIADPYFLSSVIRE